MKHFSVNSSPALWLILSLVSAGSMAYYVADIWSANQPPQFSDLYAPWWAAHELLLHGRNPYSPAVAHEIQTVIYGAPVTPSRNDPSGIGGGFSYPPYASLPLWPLVYVPFPAAQKIFLFASTMVTALSLAIWVRIVRLRFKPVQWFITVVFVLGSFPALQAIKLQNLSVVASAMLALTLFLVAADHLVFAGALLAVSTFKPQFTITLVPWLLIWTCSDWRRRRSLAWSFLATMVLLISFSEWLTPNWIGDFLHVIRAYQQYTYGHSLLDVWFSPTFGPIVSAVLVLLAWALCWPHRYQPADSAKFVLVTSLLLAANVVVIPTLAPHAQLLLLPGFLCLLPGFAIAPKPQRFSRILRASAWMLLAWSWIAAVGLLLARTWFSAPALLRFWQVPLYTSPLLPLAMLLALIFALRAEPDKLDS